jgi:hypothetical protein
MAEPESIANVTANDAIVFMTFPIIPDSSPTSAPATAIGPAESEARAI